MANIYKFVRIQGWPVLSPGGDLAAPQGVHWDAISGSPVCCDLDALGEGVSTPHESVGELSWATLSWELGWLGAARMEQ